MDARVDETPTPGEIPSQRGSSSNQNRNVQHTAQRHRGARESIKMASLNIKGRRSGEVDKWMHIPQIMREKRIGILAVQETHLTDEIAQQFNNLFSNTLSLIFSPDPTTCNARGIALVLNK